MSDPWDGEFKLEHAQLRREASGSSVWDRYTIDLSWSMMGGKTVLLYSASDDFTHARQAHYWRVFSLHDGEYDTGEKTKQWPWERLSHDANLMRDCLAATVSLSLVRDETEAIAAQATALLSGLMREQNTLEDMEVFVGELRKTHGVAELLA